MATAAVSAAASACSSASASAAARQGDREDEDECVICFEALASKGGAVPLPCECRVSYCASCWDRSLAASVTACGRALCPSCRASMRVDFDGDRGLLVFSRAEEPSAAAPDEEAEEASAFDDSWRRRLYEQAKPRQIQLLQRYGAAGAACGGSSASRTAAPQDSDSSATQPPRCVCGSRLRCVSVRDRVMTFVSEEAPVPPPEQLVELLMQSPPIVCDICDARVGPASKVWTCENGRKTVLHAVAYDVCDACFALHAHGGLAAGADANDSGAARSSGRGRRAAGGGVASPPAAEDSVDEEWGAGEDSDEDESSSCGTDGG